MCLFFFFFFFLDSAIANKPRSEMTEEELRQQEEVEFNTGPLSVLQQSVKNNNQILISCRNNHKLFARVKAFDRHCNMVLENVKEVKYHSFCILQRESY